MANEITEITPEDDEAEFFGKANVFDVERFDQIMKVASVMAVASVIPTHLKVMVDGKLDFEATRGNCFVICNLAANWKLDPFQVAQASAMVYNKIVLEGKLIRAVIKKYLGFDLSYRFFGEKGNMERRVYVSDKPLVKQGVTDPIPMSEDEILAAMLDPNWKITKGTLKTWHTKNKNGGINDNWAQDEDKMFRERGSREWCREYSPGLMLGVYTPDEFDELDYNSRSNKAREINAPITSNPLIEDKKSVAMERVDAKTGEVVETSSKKNNEQQKNTSQQAGGKSSVRAPRGAGGPEDGGGEGGSTARLAAPIFEEFSTTLLRFGSVDSLKKASNDFWESKGGFPQIKAEYDLGAKIYDLHVQRAEGKLTIENIKRAATEIISEFFAL